MFSNLTARGGLVRSMKVHKTQEASRTREVRPLANSPLTQHHNPQRHNN